MTAIRGLPALAAAAYVATVAVLGSQLVRVIDWNTDISGPLALAERLRGSGAVYLPHFGAWTIYWYLLATRWIPGHAQLWEATGYVFTIVTALVVGWATTRVAGRWAGVTAGAAALLVGPVTLRALMSVIYHVTNPFTAAVLGAYVVLLTRTRSWWLAVGVGLLAGANVASDPLLWIAGIAPFAFAAAVLSRTTRSIDVALRAGVLLGVTVVSAVITDLAMHGLGYRVVGLNLSLAPLHDLPSNALHLARIGALLGGANYAFNPGYPREPVRMLLAVLVLTAIAAPIVAAVKSLVRPARPLLRAYAAYWGAVSLLLCIVFVVTPNAAALGYPSVYYLLSLAPAAGVGIALLAARSRTSQVAVALAVAVVAAINIAAITQGRVGGEPPLAIYQRRIEQVLDRHHVRRGYAGYWDAQNLSWQTGMHLLVAPVTRCTTTQLCPYNFFTIHSWYEPRSEPTFLLLDSTNGVISGAPPFVAGATGTYHFGPLTLYLFRYDIAKHVRRAAT